VVREKEEGRRGRRTEGGKQRGVGGKGKERGRRW